MKVLIVDDEPLARRRLIRLLQQIDPNTVVIEAADGVDALEQVRSHDPDALLLDIRMPGMDGLTLALNHQDLPPIIFTTAHDEYAVTAFDAAAVDYLLKPVQVDRLQRALGRVEVRKSHPEADQEAIVKAVRQALQADPLPATGRIIAHEGSTTHFFDARQITRLYAADKYVVLRHSDTEYLVDESLNQLEARLSVLGFFRTHRGDLVNLHHVRSLKNDPSAVIVMLSDGQSARVSRRLLGELQRALQLREAP